MGHELIPLGAARFQIKVDGDDRFFLQFRPDSKSATVHYTMNGSDPIVLERYTPATYTSEELGRFAGTYYSEELNAAYVLDASKGTLVADNRRGTVVSFRSIGPDKFAGDQRFMGAISFVRGNKGEVTGFRIVVDEVRKLEFRKLRESIAR